LKRWSQTHRFWKIDISTFSTFSTFKKGGAKPIDFGRLIFLPLRKVDQNSNTLAPPFLKVDWINKIDTKNIFYINFTNTYYKRLKT